VQPWSAEFYGIVFAILDRINDFEKIARTLAQDEDLKNDTLSILGSMRQAFTRNTLAERWRDPGGPSFLRREISQPIKMLSAQVRPIARTPKLAPNEINELLAQIDDLLTWLRSHQTSDQDFIRQALIDGLEQFRFRLNKLKWVGLGYALKSLREVIGAYMALERQQSLNCDPISEAILKKTESFLRSTYKKLTFIKDTAELGEFLIKVYGLYSITKATGISGLIAG
jgi:hypothetical protein